MIGHDDTSEDDGSLVNRITVGDDLILLPFEQFIALVSHANGDDDEQEDVEERLRVL